MGQYDLHRVTCVVINSNSNLLQPRKEELNTTGILNDEDFCKNCIVVNFLEQRRCGDPLLKNSSVT